MNKTVIFSFFNSILFQVYGKILAWPDRSAYEKDSQKWIVFKDMESFGVAGDGTFDGNGKNWWQHSCKVNKNLVR